MELKTSESKFCVAPDRCNLQFCDYNNCEWYEIPVDNCEHVGFKHLWSYEPGAIPGREGFRTCENCGQKENFVILQEKITEWQEVKDE